MNILVTGIDGFVGSHLTELLMAVPGVSVSGLVVDPSRIPLIEKHRSRLNLLKVDIRRKEEVFEAVKACRPGRIFHLAGQAYVPTSMKDPLDTYSININGGIHLLEAVRQFAPECRVLLVSSGEVYGRVPPDAEVDESYPLKPENPYAASKACLDLISQQYRMSFGVKTVVARAFNHLGPGQSDVFVGSAFARQVAEVRLGLRQPVISVGNLEAQRDFTDVRDVVRAYYALLEVEPKYAVYNISSGKPVAVKEILDRLIFASGVRVKVEKDPARMRTIDSPVVVGSHARLTAETGWTPTIGLEQTLGDILAYWERRLRPS
jgi:GDP-4-dehydro-6-deoxy-D-mannose reductase